MTTTTTTTFDIVVTDEEWIRDVTRELECVYGIDGEPQGIRDAIACLTVPEDVRYAIALIAAACYGDGEFTETDDVEKFEQMLEEYAEARKALEPYASRDLRWHIKVDAPDWLTLEERRFVRANTNPTERDDVDLAFCDGLGISWVNDAAILLRGACGDVQDAIDMSMFLLRYLPGEQSNAPETVRLLARIDDIKAAARAEFDDLLTRVALEALFAAGSPAEASEMASELAEASPEHEGAFFDALRDYERESYAPRA